MHRRVLCVRKNKVGGDVPTSGGEDGPERTFLKFLTGSIQKHGQSIKRRGAVEEVAEAARS